MDTTRHPRPAEAVRHCQSAIDRHRGRDHGLVTAVCAHLYVEDGCRTAIQQIGNVSLARRPRVVAAACTRAYCDILPERPRLCDVNLQTARLPEVVEHWQEFQRAVYRFDLGSEHEESALNVFQPFPPPSERIAPEPPATPPLRVTLEALGRGFQVRLIEPSGHVHRQRYYGLPTAAMMSSLFERVADLPRSTHVVVEVPHGGDAQASTIVYEAAQAAGFVTVVLELG